jgi:precorrin-4/cobalt-precorrin-4 C11-methyltransferase
MSAGRVRFVGCGPGAPDLLTLRAVRAIAAADIVVWSPSLLDEAVVIEHARPGAELVGWPPATQRDVVAVYDRAAREGLQVVRLKGGDPAFFGELQDDLRELRALGVDVEVVPGVSAVSAGAAALCCEIASSATPLVLAAAGAEAGADPGVVGVLNTGRDPAAVAAGLAARGLAPATPCAVLVAISRPSEIVVTCTLDELAETLRDYGSPGLTTVLAGAALASAGPSA